MPVHTSRSNGIEIAISTSMFPCSPHPRLPCAGAHVFRAFAPRFKPRASMIACPPKTFDIFIVLPPGATVVAIVN
jgi:hypothetical protein